MFSILASFCRKKFRTLRERYTRELRKSYLEPETAISYEYFQYLNFLNPFIKFRSISFENANDGKPVVQLKRDETLTILHKSEPSERDDVRIIEDIYEEANDQEDNDQTSYVQESPEGETHIIYTTSSQVPTSQAQPIQQDHHRQIGHHQVEEQHFMIEPSKLSTSGTPRKRTRSVLDADSSEDEGGNRHFALSIASSLKRLNTISNLRAKVEIFKVLEKFTEMDHQNSK